MTVHKDVTERLKDIDKKLWEGVREVLDKNLSERHIRGGIATKNKYLRSEKIYNNHHAEKPCACVKNPLPCEKRESMSCRVCNKTCPNRDLFFT